MSIYEHWQRGDYEADGIKKALKSNIIPYCEINRAFILSRSSGMKYDDALFHTADRMNVSQRTVKRAISFVKQ